MRLKRTFLISVVTAALAVAVGTTPGHAADKPDGSGRQTGSSKNLVPADVAAGRAAPAVSAAVRAAAAAVRSRIVDFVLAHGTKNTFGTYVNPTTGRVVVETDAPSAVVASLVGSFGATVEVRKLTVSDQFSRRSDSPPFWGGAGVALTAGTPRCSDGYTVQDSAGTRFMVDAGHCFTDGQTVVAENTGLTVGTVSGNGLPSQDMELIGGQSYAPDIYLGGVDSTDFAHIASAGDPVVGFNDYCHSGRTTGENCGHTVKDVNATVCTSSGCKSPVIAFTGGNLPQGGDSGSPFYVGSVAAPDKHIRGHIIAGDGTTEYAELWSRVAARFGVTIVT